MAPTDRLRLLHREILSASIFVATAAVHCMDPDLEGSERVLYPALLAACIALLLYKLVQLRADRRNGS